MDKTVTTWSKMDTAPTHGCNIIVAVPYPKYDDYLIYIAYCSNGFWVSEECGEISPTHWMPLPEKPHD